jgi:hypothetical protein
MGGFLHIEAMDSMKKAGIYLDGRLVRLLPSGTFERTGQKAGNR